MAIWRGKWLIRRLILEYSGTNGLSPIAKWQKSGQMDLIVHLEMVRQLDKDMFEFFSAIWEIKRTVWPQLSPFRPMRLHFGTVAVHLAR